MALAAMSCSMRSGRIFIRMSFIPPDSNWKMPSVSPRQKIPKTFGSSRGSFSGSTSLPVLARTRSRARWIVVSVRRPRKSIFISPTFSQVGPSHCVIRSSLSPWV
jgi:hypothetical protein